MEIMDMNLADLGAFGFWMFLAIIIVAGIWSDIKKREVEHETIRRSIESGNPIDKDDMVDLFESKKTTSRDLKIGGLITLFVAPGLAAMGWFLSTDGDDVLTPLIGVSALVAFIGVGIILAGVFAGKKDKD